jgi:hypothetical protein
MLLVSTSTATVSWAATLVVATPVATTALRPVLNSMVEVATTRSVAAMLLKVTFTLTRLFITDFHVGWINKEIIGTAPWDKEWMIPAAGMKVDDSGEIVDDPAATIELTVMIVRNETFEFDPEADYEHYLHDLEAYGGNQSYANIPSTFTMVRPKYDFVANVLKSKYPGTIDFSKYPEASPFKDGAPSPVASLSPASTRCLSPAGSSSTLFNDDDAYVDEVTPNTPNLHVSFETAATSFEANEEKWLAELGVFERGQTAQ